MDPLSLSLAFSSGIALGVVLDHWILPALVDAWIRFARIGRQDGR